MMPQRFQLIDSFHKVGLRMQRVEKQDRELQAGGRIRWVNEGDFGVFHLRRGVGLSNGRDTSRGQSGSEDGFFGSSSLFAGETGGFEGCEVGCSVFDFLVQCEERSVCGIERKAGCTCVEGFGEFVEGEAGGGGAVPCFDIFGVEAEGSCGVAIGGAVVF